MIKRIRTAMKYTTILFDADDTLLDFHLAEYQAIKSVLLEFGLPYDDSVISAYSEINLSFWKLLELGQIKKDELKIRRFEAFCERMGFKVDAEKMAFMYMEALSNQNPLKEGAEELCKNLFGKYHLYIITNGIRHIQTRRFSTCPISKYFDKIFISEEIGFEKPKIEFFDAVSAQIPGFDKRKTLVVGDSLTSDIQGGINYGLDTCWFNPKGKAKPDGMDITYEISRLEEIYEILK